MEAAINRPAAFFDRDGTLIKSPPGGTYFSDPAQVVVNEYAVAWVKACNQQGFPVLVVTNQSGVGKGLVTAEQVEAVNQRMQLAFSERGAEITDVLYCPHVQGECSCRKPGLGLLEQYERMYQIDRLKSIMFGDSWQDFQFAKNARIHYIQLQQYYISRPCIAEAKRFLKCDIPVL